MRVSEIFPSQYVKAADLQGKTVPLTIRSVTLEELTTCENKKSIKPVVWFQGTKKGFVLNVTNALAIAHLHGDEMDDWGGKRIAIYPTQVKAFGAIQDCIRVKDFIPAPPKPAAQSVPAEEPTGIDDEDVTDYGDEVFDTDTDGDDSASHQAANMQSTNGKVKAGKVAA